MGRKNSLLRRLYNYLLNPFRGHHDVHRPDYILLGVIVIIVFFGLLMLSSATTVIGFEKYGDSYYFLKQQLFRGVLPGVVLFLIVIRINYQSLKKYGILWYLLTLGLLLIVFIPGLGISLNSARSWISIGGITIQTSELAKLTLIIYLALWLHNRIHTVSRIRETVAPFLILLAPVVLMLILQPDVGTLAIFMIVSIVMLFVSGLNWIHLGALALLGSAAIGALVAAAPYRIARFTTFLHPEADPKGSGYQLLQALIAIGSGGFWGLGLGHSQQKFQYLPEVAADSIFAIMAEEWGLLFSVLFVLLYVIFFYRALKIIKATDDYFGKILATGIASWIVLQAFINICAIIGLMPLTGVPLPFVSLGGTNLVVVLCASAILLNISRYTKE